MTTNMIIIAGTWAVALGATLSKRTTGFWMLVTYLIAIIASIYLR